MCRSWARLDDADQAFALAHDAVAALGLADPDRVALRVGHEHVAARELAERDCERRRNGSGQRRERKVLVDYGRTGRTGVFVSSAESAVCTEAVLRARRHRDEVSADSVEATVLNLCDAIMKSPWSALHAHQELKKDARYGTF